MLSSGKHQLCPKSCTPPCIWLPTASDAAAHGQGPAGHWTPQGSQGFIQKPLSMEKFSDRCRKKCVLGNLGIAELISCSWTEEKDLSAPQASPWLLSLLCGLGWAGVPLLPAPLGLHGLIPLLCVPHLSPLPALSPLRRMLIKKITS